MKMRLHNYHRRMEEAGDLGSEGGGAPAAAAPAAGGSLLADGAAPAAANLGGAPAAAVTIPENWKESLSEEYRNDPSLGAINNLESLAKSYIHSQKMIGKGKMSIPDEHSSDADWKQIYQTLGLPEKSEDYSFDVPDDAQFDDGFITKLKEIGFEQGILPKQMKGLVDWYSTANNEALQLQDNQRQVEVKEGMSKLKQEWGQAFDQNVNMAKAALKGLDMGDQVYDWLNATGMGDDPNMVKLLSAMGQMMKEDKLIGDFGEAVAAPKELEGRVEELQQSPAYMDKAHPNHSKVMKEMQDLFQQLHPKKQESHSQLT